MKALEKILQCAYIYKYQNSASNFILCNILWKQKLDFEEPEGKE